MTIDEAFSLVKNAFPITAEFQGTHFKYASANGIVLIEKKRWDEIKGCPIFNYWLLVNERFKLVHASQISKFRSLRTVGESFSPKEHGDQ